MTENAELIVLPGGSLLSRTNQSIVVKLNGANRVLSTSFLNGGYRDDLLFLFNYSEVYGAIDGRCEMKAPTNEGHLVALSKLLNLDPAVSTGLSTAAKVKLAVIKTEAYRDFSVTAVVTAGVDYSACRAGDPAQWHENRGRPFFEDPGTINILLFVDAVLTPGALVRSLTVCTEAKVAALQELIIPSCSSKGLATGSGTDGSIIVSNVDSRTQLTNAGPHTKLGELIGKVVKDTVKESLYIEEGFRNYSRSSLHKRIARLGLTPDYIWSVYQENNLLPNCNELDFRERLTALDANDQLIATATLFAYLIDLAHWGLIDAHDAFDLAGEILGYKKPIAFSVKQKELPEQLSNYLADFLVDKIVRSQV